MSDDEDDDGGGGGDDVQRLPGIVNEAAAALEAGSVSVRLVNGRQIEGAIASIMVRKKEKKGATSWGGNLKVRTETGILEIDWTNIESIALK